MPQEVGADALPAVVVAALKKLYGGPAPGRFLLNQHGFTHYQLEGPANGKLAVLSHGIGTNMRIFDGPIREKLLASGFRVLTYDFYNHGWSHGREMFMVIDKDAMLLQLSEVLDHVLAAAEPVDLWVGHSTGGIVGVLYAATNTAHPIRELALISPAFWANKPLIAQVADKIPSFMFGLVKNGPGVLKVLPQNAYLENNDVAFGKVGKKYMFPELYEDAKVKIKRMFEVHPQAVGGILGVATWFLREDLLAEYRATFERLVQAKDGPRVHLLWGKHDVVVPFERSKDVLSWSSTPGKVVLTALDAGHESPVEVPTVIAKEILTSGQIQSKM